MYCKKNKPGDEVLLKGLTSCSVNKHDKSYATKQTEFLRYEIIAPKGTPALVVSQLEEFLRNEPDEVILPPTKCKVKNVATSDISNCKGVVEICVIEVLNIDYDKLKNITHENSIFRKSLIKDNCPSQ